MSNSDTLSRIMSDIFNNGANPERNTLVDLCIRFITDVCKKHKMIDLSGPSDVQSISFV